MNSFRTHSTVRPRRPLLGTSWRSNCSRPLAAGFIDPTYHRCGLRAMARSVHPSPCPRSASWTRSRERRGADAVAELIIANREAGVPQGDRPIVPSHRAGGVDARAVRPSAGRPQDRAPAIPFDAVGGGSECDAERAPHVALVEQGARPRHLEHTGVRHAVLARLRLQDRPDPVPGGSRLRNGRDDHRTIAPSRSGVSGEVEPPPFPGDPQTTSAWWTSRSTRAATATGSPKISAQAEKVLLELTMRKLRS